MVKTAQGNSISLYKNEKHNSVLVLACMHGDEPQGEYLIKEYLNFKPNTKLMFVPCVNPDGVASKTRVNSNGVDINRNFPTKNWELTEKNEFFGGEKPMSEIETKFLVDVIEQNKPNLILTLHAPFKVVNYDGDAQEVAEKVSEIIGYPVEASIGYPTPGSFGTWAGIENKIPTITLELDEEIDVKELREPMFKIFEMLEKY